MNGVQPIEVDLDALIERAREPVVGDRFTRGGDVVTVQKVAHGVIEYEVVRPPDFFRPELPERQVSTVTLGAWWHLAYTTLQRGATFHPAK